jgi:uncharacterized membrane protein YcaP (DUF421 family)
MGKRQIGEMQPAELVVTIMISELATSPMQDMSLPLANAVIPILAIVILEIFLSVISMKSNGIRGILEGNSIIVVKNGKPIEKSMKKLRINTGDLLEQLRLNNVFDIEKVEYAIIETNGKMSVLLKPQYQTLDADTIKAKADDDDRPFLIVSDGKYQKRALKNLNLKISDVEKELKKKKIPLQDVFMMTADDKKNYNIIRKSDREGEEG